MRAPAGQSGRLGFKQRDTCFPSTQEPAGGQERGFGGSGWGQRGLCCLENPRNLRTVFRSGRKRCDQSETCSSNRWIPEDVLSQRLKDHALSRGRRDLRKCHLERRRTAQVTNRDQSKDDIKGGEGQSGAPHPPLMFPSEDNRTRFYTLKEGDSRG